MKTLGLDPPRPVCRAIKRLQLFRAHAGASRTHAGNLASRALQGRDEPALLSTVEAWRDEAALDARQQTGGRMSLKPRFGAMMVGKREVHAARLAR